MKSAIPSPVFLPPPQPITQSLSGSHCVNSTLSVHFKVYALTQCPRLDIQPHWNHQGQQALLKQTLTRHWQSVPFSVCPPLILPWEMNAQQLIQSADLESYLNRRRLESEFIRGPSFWQHQPYFRLLTAAFQRRILRFNQTPVITGHARRPATLHVWSMPVWGGSETDVWKYRWNSDCPCSNSWDVSY